MASRTTSTHVQLGPNFGGRKKRAIGEAPEVNEEVPSIMETGNGALQWVKSLVRRARNAEPEDGKGGKGGKAKGKGKGKGGKAGEEEGKEWQEQEEQWWEEG